MKKKLSMLMALALCTTVGGVYAAWVYSTDSIPSGYGVSNLGITGVDYVGNSGSISVVGTNTEIKIDDPTNAHLTKMTFDDQGYFTVTFTPSETASESVKDGMDVKWYVGLSDGKNPMSVDNFLYTFEEEPPQKIFTTIHSEKVLVKQADMTPVDSDDDDDIVDYYTFTIPMTDVVGKLELAEIELKSEDRYTAYLTALKNGYIHVHAEVVDNT